MYMACPQAISSAACHSITRRFPSRNDTLRCRRLLPLLPWLLLLFLFLLLSIIIHIIIIYIIISSFILSGSIDAVYNDIPSAMMARVSQYPALLWLPLTAEQPMLVPDEQNPKALRRFLEARRTAASAERTIAGGGEEVRNNQVASAPEPEPEPEPGGGAGA